MKIKNIKFALILLVLFGCQQEVITLEDPIITPPITSGTKGTANFTKFVAIGNSYVAGVQAGALFTESQNNSLPAIMAKQFSAEGVGGGAFIQADIKATLGYNLFIAPNPGADGKVIGRLLLQYGTSIDCETKLPSPKPAAQLYPLGNLEAVPNPSYNPAFIYTGGKATLNNFGVPAIVLGQALIPQTGDWTKASDPDPIERAKFSPFYGRLAAPPGGSTTIIGDAAAAGGSFFMFYLGLDDFFLYAAFGGDPTRAPLTNTAAFNGQYQAAIGALLNSNANLKGVVGNFPDIFVMPHFTSVKYNPIPMDAATATAVSAGFAGYNSILDAIIGNPALLANFGLTATELTSRKVSFTASCTNSILIKDETLKDLGPVLDYLKSVDQISEAQRTALTPYQLVRQTTSTDIIPLSAGSVIGTMVGGNPNYVNGITIPLEDRYALIPTEIAAIKAAREAFNATVQATVTANPTRLALADINTALAGLVSAKAGVINGVTITPNINPPTGIYSEDGVHPNSRGYAYLSTVFIKAINASFGATVPLTDISTYSATALPIP